MTIDRTPSVQALAPLIDHLRELAADELPSPQTCKVRFWDDGDYDVVVYHSRGPNSREQLVYNRETGEVKWQYWKQDPDWEPPNPEEIPDCDERIIEPDLLESNERTITTLTPPPDTR